MKIKTNLNIKIMDRNFYPLIIKLYHHQNNAQDKIVTVHVFYTDIFESND